MPSANQKGVYKKLENSNSDFKSDFSKGKVDPQQFRWKPMEF
jgi:hypothetical protein